MPAKPDDAVLHGFGERIRTLRNRSGLTQAELANEIKVTKQAISWWEQGFTPDCSALALYRASMVLNTTMEYLIAGKSFLSTVCSNSMVMPQDADRERESRKADAIDRAIMDQATARDEMPETMEELADAEYIESMSEAEVDQATLDAGRDPNAVVEKALKSIEVSHD